MRRKVITIWLSLVIISSFIVVLDVIINITPTTQGTTLYVNETGSGGAFMRIQDAIDNASDGDTVFVYNGSYYDHLYINKTISLNGEEKNSTFIDGSGNGYVISIDSNWANVSGFSVINGITGIYIAHSKPNNTIMNNNIYSN
jgi:nitrous oxidase accessory protein NosD